MGDASARTCPPGRRREMRDRVLQDVQRLERLLDEEAIESGPIRIGAEQEMFLVGPDGAPAHVAEEVLGALSDGRFAPEVGRFNLEANVRPRSLAGSCLRELEVELSALAGLARRAAARAGADVVLAGILPSLSETELCDAAMMPRPRYRALDHATRAAHPEGIRVRIRGDDELALAHGNMMLEACATSFQVHLQVAPRAFASLYDRAQLVAAPLVACAGNAPVFLGRRLWEETRIPLLEQAADFRSPSQRARGEPGRLGLGPGWLDGTLAQLFRDDLARWAPILWSDALGDAPGSPPRLAALQLHNGTVWRWNRPCYGVGDGRPHLRIECRVLPAGPTIADEVANAAFWLGLMTAGPDGWGDVRRGLPFEEVRANLHRAARDGLAATFTWLGGRSRNARELILSDLLPLAREGLVSSRVDAADADRALGIVEERVRSGRTGAVFLREAFEQLGDARAVVRLLGHHLASAHPVHAWRRPARLPPRFRPVRGGHAAPRRGP